MTYRECPAPASLRELVACTWTQLPAVDTVQLVVPDGCVDLVWLADRELVVVGPDTGPHEVVLPGGARSIGVRLRPGAAGTFLGLPAAELRDTTVAAADVRPEWADLDGDSLLEAIGPGRADPLVRRAAALLARPGARVAGVAADLGVGERQLHRRCLTAVGYGPKTLARVARLQRLRHTGGRLADRALAAGYASQAHMGDEVRRLTGLTAVRFLEDRPAPAA